MFPVLIYSLNVIYSCDDKAEFSASLLPCHIILQKSF